MPHAFARAWRWITGEAWVFDPLGAGARLPAIALPIAIGAAAGRPLAGILAAGGAFTVGFGAPLDLRGSKSLLLVLASAAIGTSAIIGSLAAAHAASAVLVAMGFGLLCGRAARAGAGPAWIGLQSGLAAMIATSYPASFDRASLRALLIVAGGLAQAGTLSIARFARKRHASPPAPEPSAAGYVITVAVGLAAAMLVERLLALRSGYWVPMTTLLVLRPQGRSTMTRALARVVGTIGGAALASALLVVLRPPAPGLAVLVTVAAFGAYLFQKASYGLLSACVTGYVVFILSLAGLKEREVATARIAATALGGAVALGVQGTERAFRRRREAEAALE